ncbi:LysR family transcriptional regulator [Burkholderia multivorans]|uniref:LysR family transcriptional regulator n=1 Tax=Burkholderia ubonensis TaxID=101571 RepID=UPI000F6D344B|nr:LysR family transcriptional regulator [Burkholderia ubonensis]AYZ63453.1 LysR family transcriptional regulator [Burkholderia multivorans]VWC20580.1 LysR family transcriptional regulator [Burkholderia ubonensis]
MDLLSAMRIFVRVVERGNLSRAARDLGLGQPAVSDRIERLERHLGVRLLLRSTRAVSCTDEGALFYQKSKVVLDAADEAQAAVTPGDDAVRGRIRIAAPHGIGEVVLPGVMAAIRERHPKLLIDLVLNDAVTDPVTEGVDISLRLGALGNGNFVARRLGHVRRVLVAARAYVDAHGRPQQPADLAAHPFIRVAGLFADGQLRLARASEAPRPTPIDIVVSTSHWRPAYEMLVGGAGIGVLQEPVCGDALASGRLVELLPGHTVPGFELHALYPAARPAPAKTQAVMKILEAQLRPAFATDAARLREA